MEFRKMVVVPVSHSISNGRFVAAFANYDNGGRVSCRNLEAHSVRTLPLRRWPSLEEVFVRIS